jgi:hypothetical protein
MSNVDNVDDVEAWLAVRKAEALKINPLTAEVVFDGWAHVLDPYGVRDDLPAEGKCIGRTYFARRPESEIWVAFNDLPAETLRALSKEIRSPFGRPGAEVPMIIRTLGSLNGDLILTVADQVFGDWEFILTFTDGGPNVCMLGWLHGRDCMRPKFKVGEHWAIPQSALRSPESLRRERAV